MFHTISWFSNKGLSLNRGEKFEKFEFIIKTYSIPSLDLVIKVFLSKEVDLPQISLE